MSTYRSRRLDEDTAEQLLRGEPTEPAHTHLAALLSAAQSPPRPAEYTGQPAALAAFQAARLAPIRPVRRTVLAGRLTVRMGAVSLAVLGLGGVAVAATTGALPAALHHGSQVAGARGHAPRPSALPSPATSRTPGSSLIALCRRYADHDRDHRSRMLNDPDMHDLVVRAGSRDRDRVDDFCAKLLHHNGSSPRPSSTPDGRTDGHPDPTGYPGDHDPPAPTRPAHQ